MELEVILGLPGTGKTTELLARVRTLLNEKYVPDDFIVCTYRREMAKEIRNRLINNITPDFKDAQYITTIHGLCKRLLGLEKQQIVDNADIVEFAETYKYEYTSDSKYEEEENALAVDDKISFLNLVLSLRGWLVANISPMSQWRQCPTLPIDHLITTENFILATDRWGAWKADRSLYDFDDMLVEVHERGLAPEAPILIVDEFQDISPLKYAIYQNWKKGKEHVIIAGDPYQSIYSFMGATPFFFEAEQALANKLTILKQSHRLPQPVWCFARRCLERVGYAPPEIEPTQRQGQVTVLPNTQYAPTILQLKEGDSVMHLARARYMKYIIAGQLDSLGILHNLYPKKQLLLRDAIKKVRRNETPTTVEFIALVQAYPAASLLGREKKSVLADLKNPPTNRLAPWQPTLQWLFMPDALAAMKGPRPFDSALISYLPESARDRLTKALDYMGGSHKILTIHAAKGGEAETVFLYDASTKKIDRSTQTEAGRREEARVAFVGATRASRDLYIVKDFFYTSYRLELPRGVA